jgi:hypothetical protein
MERCEKYCVLSIDHSSRFDYELGYCGYMQMLWVFWSACKILFIWRFIQRVLVN